MRSLMAGCAAPPLQSSSKKKREVERCTTVIQGLKAELAAQENNQRLVLARLEEEKEGWFSTGGGRVTGRGVVTGKGGVTRRSQGGAGLHEGHREGRGHK